ncbi:DUF6177 family protein [Saccharothrix sp. S26]|uniref:DUF6177 family protein n=1 Tax=Saccharothrix sp. S26 TaxID=2907215 RepID=UPI001F331071|nr:DUF6177 family protein [Saccharothrix sp. S26]MCE6996887.1 DUF6177 family protein [Saccharothrix sp. S26]
MVEPVTWHPAADRLTPEALVVEQDRRVVGLSGWLADAAVTAVGSGRLLQVLTPSYSRITYPLEVMFGAGRSQWVVRDGTGFRDGFTGVPMHWNGNRFAPTEGALPEITLPPAGSGGIEVLAVASHPAAATLELGTVADHVFRALTGDQPTGWGVSEPATHPWSRREVTAHCRERSPRPTRVVVVGDDAVGVLEVERVDTGVLERVKVSGPASGRVGQDAVEAMVDALAPTARTVVVSVHPTRVAGARPSTPTPPALPYGILIGAEAVTDPELARSAPAPSARLAGRPDRPSCWVRLSGGPRAPYETLTAVLRHFGLPEQPTG